jgi:predicted lysophospholipase L1 biosynthesis ABC-type transport system permease subunit
MKSRSKYSGLGITLGAAFGAAFGVIAGNIGVWLAIGVAIGVVLGATMRQKEPACPHCDSRPREQNLRANS